MPVTTPCNSLYPARCDHRLSSAGDAQRRRGLPWASLPIALQERVFGEIHRALVPGGAFMTFAYLHGLILPGAQALRQRLQTSFASVTHSPTVWANVPPAFAYICRTEQ